MDKKTLFTVDIKVSDFEEVKLLLKEQQQEITYLRKELTITQNNYDMLWKDHQYLITDFVKLQDERGVIREQD